MESEEVGLTPLERIGLGLSHALMARATTRSDGVFERYPDDAPRPSLRAIFDALRQAAPDRAVVLQGVPAELWAQLEPAHRATRLHENDPAAQATAWQHWRRTLKRVRCDWLSREHAARSAA